MHAADPIFVVQVRAGGEAGHADVADDLPEIDVLAAAQLRRESRQVAVDGDDAGAVLEFDDVAEAALAARRT